MGDIWVAPEAIVNTLNAGNKTNLICVRFDKFFVHELSAGMRVEELFKIHREVLEHKE